MAAPQTGLTNCQIGGIGYPRKVHGNPRHIPCLATVHVLATVYSFSYCTYVMFVWSGLMEWVSFYSFLFG